MTAALLKGIILGVTVAFIVGPVFFTLLQTSINRGFKAGLQLALGVLLSDLLIIILSYIGLLQLLNNTYSYIWIGCCGGVLLIIFGLYSVTRKKKLPDTSKIAEVKAHKAGFLTYFIKGFLMNIINPFLLIFWITIVSYHAAQETGKGELIVFFGAALTTIFFTDALKCFVAKKLKRFIAEKTLLWLNRTVGIILIVFGLVLIFRVFYLVLPS